MGRRDGDAPQADAQVVRQFLRIGDAARRGIARGHCHSHHIFGPQRVHGHRGRKRRVNPAGQPHQRLPEPRLPHIIPRAYHQGLVHFFSRIQHPAEGRVGPSRRVGRPAAGHAAAKIRNGDYPRRPRRAADAVVLLPGARVAQALAKHRVHIQVGYDEAVFKGRAAGDDRPVRRADNAGAVKHQFILPAHRVQIGDEHAVVRRAGGNHTLPLPRLAGVKRRSVDIHDDLGAGFPLGHNRANGIPDVFADAHAHRSAVDDIHRAFLSPAKIAVFVKHPIVGQVHFAILVQNAAVVDNGGGVGNIVGNGDAAHNGGNAAGGRGNARHGGGVVGQKRRLEQQILRRIAGNGQLGKGYQVCVRGPRLVNEIHDAGRIAGNIPDSGVKLGQGQAKGALHKLFSVSWPPVAAGNRARVSGAHYTLTAGANNHSSRWRLFVAGGLCAAASL